MRVHGHIDIVSRTEVAGWVANGLAPQEALQVSILVNGTVAGRVTANEFRSDLVNVFAAATGRYSFRFLFTPPLSVFDTHDIAITIADNMLLSRKQIPSIAKEIMPIIVTGAGRSGSTLMMNQLGAHPEIVIRKEYPAEAKLLTYYAMALRVLTSPGDRERSSDPDTMLDDLFSVGFNPFNEGRSQHPLLEFYWNRTVPVNLARSFRELILGYYDTIRFIDEKPAMRFFAEKAQPDPIVRQCASFMFGSVREIVLIRDPRDLVCSYHSFWATELAGARQAVGSQLVPLLALWKQKSPATLFLKYEDLTMNSIAVMKQVYSFLGLSPVVGSTVDDAEVFNRHGTSRTPEASIGRWKTDLPSEDIAACNREFAPFLSTFGYGENA